MSEWVLFECLKIVACCAVLVVGVGGVDGCL